MPRNNRICGIYTITNILNKKVYVGYSVHILHRFDQHIGTLNSLIHINIHLQRAWNKYGKENFLFEVLEECEEQFLASQENYWCNMLDTHNIHRGYNLNTTSPGARKMSEEHKKKISIALIGKKLSQATKDKIGLVHKGKTRTIEERLKQGETIKRTIVKSPEWIKNMVISRKLNRIKDGRKGY